MPSHGYFGKAPCVNLLGMPDGLQGREPETSSSCPWPVPSMVLACPSPGRKEALASLSQSMNHFYSFGIVRMKSWLFAKLAL